jgi:hypothetical protein
MLKDLHVASGRLQIDRATIHPRSACHAATKIVQEAKFDFSV